MYEALGDADAAGEDVECGAAALTLVPEDAEADVASTADVAGEELAVAVCVVKKEKEGWASLKERGTPNVELD